MHSHWLPLSSSCHVLGVGYGAAVAIQLLRTRRHRILRTALCSPIAPNVAQPPHTLEAHFRRMFSASFMLKFEDRYDLLLNRYTAETSNR